LANLKPILPDTVIETDLQVVIPDKYVSNISERLALYTRLDNIQTTDELETFRQEVQDRFGPLPKDVNNLIQMVRVRWKAEKLHLEKLTLKNNILKGYFVSSEGGNQPRQAADDFFKSDAFGKVIDYLRANPAKFSLKELKGRPVFTHSDVQSVEQMDRVLESLTN
jgi:transcription-repair coupling factor (superfamily II helicase)